VHTDCEALRWGIVCVMAVWCWVVVYGTRGPWVSLCVLYLGITGYSGTLVTVQYRVYQCITVVVHVLGYLIYDICQIWGPPG